MPRLNTVDELIRRATKIELIRPVQSGGSITTETSLSAAVAKSAATYTATSPTGFVTNSPTILVGDGGTEANQVVSVASSTLTMLYKSQFGHSSLARLILAEKINLGEVETGGFSDNVSQSSTDVESATSPTVLATDVGVMAMDISFGLLGFNNENDLLRYGQREDVIGTGTATDPYQSGVGGKDADIVGPNVFRFSGVLRGGKLFHIDCLNATLTPTGSMTIGKGGAPSIPIAAKITHRIVRIWAP